MKTNRRSPYPPRYLTVLLPLMFIATAGGCDDGRMHRAHGFKFKRGGATCAVFTPDSRYIVAGAHDGIHILDVKKRSEIAVHPIERLSPSSRSQIDVVAVSPDSKYYAYGANWMPVEVREVVSGQTIRRFEVDRSTIHALAFSPDGKHLIAGTGFRLGEDGGTQDGTYDLWLWDLEKEAAKPVCFRGHEGPVRGIVFLPDGKRIVSSSNDGTLRMWDIATQKELKCAGAPEPTPRRFHVDKRDKRITLSPDGRFIVLGRYFWDLRDWKLAERFITPSDLAFASRNGRVSLPQPEGNGENLFCRPAGNLPSVLSPGGDYLIVGASPNLRMFDTATKELVFEEPVFRNSAPIEAVDVSPDGKYALTAGKGVIPGFNALDRGVRARDPVSVRLWRLPRKD